MANCTPQEGENFQSPAGSGEETLEYKKVLVNLENIIEALKAIKGAKESLCLKCTMRKWNELTAELSESEVMKLILIRIKHKAATYYEFIDMLASINGLDLVIENIKTTSFPTEESHYDRSNTSIEPTSGVDSDTTDSGASGKTEESTSKKGEKLPIKKMTPPSSSDIGNFPQPHSPSPQAVEPGVLPNLEASTAQSSEIQPTPPGVLITGSDTDHQHEAYILKLEKELREARAELEKKDKELKILNEKLKECETKLAESEQENAEMKERCETAKSDKKKAEEEHAALQLKVKALELRVSDLDKKVETLQQELHTMKDGREYDKEMQEQMKRQGEKLDLVLSRLGIKDTMK